MTDGAIDSDRLDETEIIGALGAGFEPDAGRLAAALHDRRSRLRHGDLPKWRRALRALPTLDVTSRELDRAAPTARVGDAPDGEALETALRALAPWRKGPWQIGPVTIDSEWRSDLKFSRIEAHIADPDGRRILDVGGGNGYFAFRLAGRGASSVLNVDPTLLFYCQFLALQRYLASPQVGMLPVPLEALPPGSGYDTVLSMGVLYHRRSPLHHLRRLRDQLRPGGELLLETLVVSDRDVLVPPGRYARMRNVWFLPSPALLETWLARSGFANVRTVDVTATTVDEQRTTAWMPFESLAEALDPDDPTRTREGHPAPVRVVTLAERAG